MNVIQLAQMLEFSQRGDERGHLVVVEGHQDIPFDIKRIFYIYGSDKEVVRGQHANRKSEFVLINVAGTSKVKVKDGKGNEAIYSLNRPHTGIYLPKLVWKDMPFDSLMGSMEAGDVQVIAAGIGPTEDRKKSVDFSDVYYTGTQCIISRKDNPIKDFEEMSGKTVAVLEGAQSDMIASGETTDYGEVKDAKVKRFKNASSAVMELKNGGADAVLIDNIMAEIYCKQNSDLQYESVPSTAEDTVFCIEKGNTELVQIINDGLAKVKKSGEYDDLYQKYFVDTLENSEDVTDVAATDGFLGLLSFIFLQDNRWKFYINGLGITLIVSLLSVIVGILIGLVVALVRLRAAKKGRRTILSTIADIYVDVIRGTPSVLQLMIIYFAVFHSRLGYVAAVVSFGINSGAYVSEVIRGGILSVDKG